MVYGQPVAYTATVTSTSAGTPTGTVSFLDGIVPLGSAKLNAQGQAQLTTSNLALGGNAVTAVYDGDSTFAASTSAILNQTAGEPTTTTLAAEPSSATVVSGQPVTYTATVGSTYPGTPTGTVSFYDGSTPLGSAATLNAQGQASIQATPAVGGHSITAVYSGDGTFATSTSAALSQTVLAPTTATLTANPSSSPVYGEPVTYTVNVTSSYGTPSGTVDFYDGANLMADPPLVNGQASISLPAGSASLPLGADAIRAVYHSDGTFDSSNSAFIDQTVGQAGTSTSVSSNAGSAVWGQPVTFTAKVAVQNPGSGSPSGTVNFLDGTTVICANEPVSQPGETAACQTAGLSVGPHSVTAVYSGDNDFATSTSAALTQTVAKASDSVALASSGFVATSKQAVTFTADVMPTAPGAGTPTGTVRFYHGSTLLGTGTVGSSGAATFQTASLATGDNSITAVYSGDGNFSTSTSGAITQYVGTSLSSFPKLPSGAYNLANANLMGDHLAGLNLTGASLKGANLNGVVLLLANLTGANVSGANLNDVNLSYANLTGANFSGANLNGAIWASTTCPDGTSSNADGGSCVHHLSS